jgi:hypothetical protein
VKYGFVHLPRFWANWSRLGLNDEDLQSLETLIMEQPGKGQVMQGTGGLRKLRFAPPSWHVGKSGATRVVYIIFAESSLCYLFNLFAKNEMPNLSAKDKAEAKKAVAILREINRPK